MKYKEEGSKLAGGWVPSVFMCGIGMDKTLMNLFSYFVKKLQFYVIVFCFKLLLAHMN